ncbi:Lin0512 family protein [Mameliella alba]|nr:Lin0512 family protein [Mameliella alba]MBY6170115.1 Lin0512 family protein [Mameliella alba]MBY6174908.1 Lin0512 family protein [Mameliella alba]
MIVLTEFGMGTSLRRGDYTEAAARALRDALWKSSINAAEWLGRQKADMRLGVQIAVQRPEEVEVAKLAEVFPYGSAEITVGFGGLDVPRPEGTGHPTVLAHAAITVRFEEDEV